MLTFAVDFDQPPSPSRDLVVVHDERCPHLRDPEPLGRDWRRGLAELGGLWASGSRRIAQCAIAGEHVLRSIGPEPTAHTG